MPPRRPDELAWRTNVGRGGGSDARRGGWAWRIGSTDQARWITWPTLLGLLAAASLAIIGGLPFDIPMPTYRVGLVTPTCGLTRGSTAIARGDFALAWHYNPASFLVMTFGLVGIARTTIGVTMHRWIVIDHPSARWAWALIGVLVIALWAHQQSHATFIINSRL